MQSAVNYMICALFSGFTLVLGFGSNDRILIRDLQVVTLYYGRMTTARRTHPIPQLKCLGGSAGCTSFIPQVVQCYNRGSDGEDIQWECKCDMDNSYRFGRIDVVCEGFDYPEDPYILKGSCGLEYTIDLTEEGFAKKQQRFYAHTGDGRHPIYDAEKHTSTHVIILLVIAAGIFIIYKMCLAGPHATDEHGPEGGSHRPPPPAAGFRPEFMPPSGPPPSYESCTSSSSSSTYNPYTSGTGPHTSATPGAGTGNGFWSGAALGGLAGYLFGNRGQGTTYQQHYQQPYNNNRSWFGGWSGGSSSSYSAPSHTTTSSSSFSSSGTRTASGFGGTRRR